MKGSNGHIDDTPPVIQPYTRKPLYTSLPANVSAMLHQIPTPQQPKQQRQQQPKNTGSSPVDMDLDSPFSPGSASDLSDLFEPPTGTPPAFTALGSGNNNKASPAGKKPWESSHWAKIIGGSGGGSGSGAGKESKSKRRNKRPHGAVSKSKKTVNTKVVDDRLKIIDDVPSSAVEMTVKEKFLKKVQRQERVVEEVKMVMKPAYNHKKINKDQYKEILRKAVPKICKSGEINPNKINRLVGGYIKKFHHENKKTKGKGGGGGGAPQGNNSASGPSLIF